MAVKRFTIELDDRPDTEQRTSPPPSLLPKGEMLPGSRQETNVPEHQEKYSDTRAAEELGRNPRAGELIGRTPADLVFAFVNRPEFMATILTLLALLITGAKIQKVSDVWLPIIYSLILNGVWFSVLHVKRFFPGKKPLGK